MTPKTKSSKARGIGRVKSWTRWAVVAPKELVLVGGHDDTKRSMWQFIEEPDEKIVRVTISVNQ